MVLPADSSRASGGEVWVGWLRGAWGPGFQDVVELASADAWLVGIKFEVGRIEDERRRLYY